MKIKPKVLLSLFCVMFSFCLTLMYSYVVDSDRTESEVIASTLTKSSKMPDTVKVEEVNQTQEVSQENEKEDNNTENTTVEQSTPVVEEVVAEPVVYEGMTLNELASKLNRSLKNELTDKGYLYASYSIEKGVDPYLAVAISLEETGCNYNCSSLLKSCNNVGGMKGSGCGAYGAFSSLDDGIRAFIDNIYRNYVAYGLTTADTMNSKYAENPRWKTNVNNYINIIRNN